MTRGQYLYILDNDVAETSVCIHLYLPRELFCWILLLKTLTCTY